MSYGTVQAEKMTTESGYSLGAGNASSFKNRFINGAMVIDQRNAGASVTASVTGTVTYALDRWAYYADAASKFTVQQNAGSVTPPAGFKYYLGATSSSAYSVGAVEQFLIRQNIEGYNMADWAWGTASAKPITISFWVYSSLTGTFAGNLANRTGNRSYVFTYSVPTANTWTLVSVSITGDTSGTWDSTNTTGLTFDFTLGAGTAYQTTAGVWNSSYYAGTSGAVSVVGTSGATFYVTGVQIELGTVATSFDFRSYGTELALCQRYCYKQTQSTSNEVGIGPRQATEYIKWSVTIPVTMRAAPTWTNAPTSYVSSLSASGQVTAYNFDAAATYTISGSLSVLNQLNVNGGGLYIVASSSFSGSSGNISGIAMFDSPIFSAEL